MAKFTWKVWLRRNRLTPNPNDYVAEVDTAGETRRLDDILDRIEEEGSEVSRETMRAILLRANTVKKEFLYLGYGVFDDLVHLTPRVLGAWTGKETYTEGKHSSTISANVCKEVHDTLKKDLGVHVLGIADPGAHILLVTDVATQKTDGTITPGDDILIAGDKIRVIGEPQPDGSLEPGINAYLVTEDGETATAVTRITENTPSRVVARVPASLADGSYKLRIVTRYTGGVLLKTPRVIEYDTPLIVKTA